MLIFPATADMTPLISMAYPPKYFTPRCDSALTCLCGCTWARLGVLLWQGLPQFHYYALDDGICGVNYSY